MKPKPILPPSLQVLLAVVFLVNSCPSAAAQTAIPGLEDLPSDPVLPRDFSFRCDRHGCEALSGARSPGVRLFSMPSAIPLSPLGLDSNEDCPDCSAAETEPADERRMQLGMAMDNPFYDFRRRGDPGGAGYYQLYSQVLLWDTSTTALSLGLQAFAPAGLEADGVSNGATHFRPNFAWLHDLGGGVVLQGFIGQSLRAASHWDNELGRSLRYGVALQSPCLGQSWDPNRGVHLFVEALGQYRYDGVTALRPARNWELLPGIQWRLNQNWSLFGGWRFPLADPGTENSHRVQINCIWQF